MRENRPSGSEGGGAKSIVSSYPYFIADGTHENTPAPEEPNVCQQDQTSRSIRSAELLKFRNAINM
jgi:hypothetical protein